MQFKMKNLPETRFAFEARRFKNKYVKSNYLTVQEIARQYPVEKYTPEKNSEMYLAFLYNILNECRLVLFYLNFNFHKPCLLQS